MSAWSGPYKGKGKGRRMNMGKVAKGWIMSDECWDSIHDLEPKAAEPAVAAPPAEEPKAAEPPVAAPGSGSSSTLPTEFPSLECVGRLAYVAKVKEWLGSNFTSEEIEFLFS